MEVEWGLSEGIIPQRGEGVGEEAFQCRLCKVSEHSGAELDHVKVPIFWSRAVSSGRDADCAAVCLGTVGDEAFLVSPRFLVPLHAVDCSCLRWGGKADFDIAGGDPAGGRVVRMAAGDNRDCIGIGSRRREFDAKHSERLLGHRLTEL